MSAASAATFLHLPIAHIHGGEVTSGAIDDVFRHVVTKMSHLHFAAAEDYARRIVQMGEMPKRVHVVGAVGLDNFVKLDLPSREAFMHDINLAEGQPYALFTYHPATMESDIRFDGLEAALGALDMFPDICAVITKANSDPGGRRINARLEAFAAEHPERVRLVTSLVQRRYLTAMRHAEFVIGIRRRESSRPRPLIFRRSMSAADKRGGWLPSALCRLTRPPQLSPQQLPKR